MVVSHHRLNELSIIMILPVSRGFLFVLDICGCVYFSKMLPAMFFSIAYVVTNFKIIIAMDVIAWCLDFAVARTCPNVAVFCMFFKDIGKMLQ
jgi:hypothetical protein